MTHIIYQTEGIVLGKRDFGEAERVYNIYTEKFGMIIAVAQGVRYIKSKLRYNLDLFTYGNFAIVRGKDIWRITDAREIKSINNNNLSLFSRIAGFLLRMVKGEERNDFIWQKVKNIKDRPWETQGRSLDLEIETMAEILHNLGYMANIPQNKKERVLAINKAIKESML